MNDDSISAYFEEVFMKNLKVYAGVRKNKNRNRNFKLFKICTAGIISVVIFYLGASNKDNNIYDEVVCQADEHKIVQIVRNVNLWFGKNEIKQITAPAGYRIVDYDYDKTDGLEFETIVYENIVPVEVKDSNQLGKPLVEVEENENTNMYGVG